MPDITHPALQRLQTNFKQILGIKFYNDHIRALDQVQLSIIELRSLLAQPMDEPQAFADQVFTFFKDTLLPAFHNHLLKPSVDSYRSPLVWYIYNTVSCVTGFVADVVNQKCGDKLRAVCLLEMDKISNNLHDIWYPDWSAGYIESILNDLEHILGADRNKPAYKDHALLRQKVYVLLDHPTDENAKNLATSLDELINKLKLIKLIPLCGDSASAAIFQVICLMRYCLQTMPVSTATNIVNTQYAKVLLKLLPYDKHLHHGMYYGELQNTLRNPSGMMDETHRVASAYVKSYEEGPSRLMRILFEAPSVVPALLRAQTKAAAWLQRDHDQAFLERHAEAYDKPAREARLFRIHKNSEVNTATKEIAKMGRK